MKFEMKVTCDNAAFADDPYDELARIVRRLADDLKEYRTVYARLYDINGNDVGTANVFLDK